MLVDRYIVMIKVLVFSQGSLDTNYSISLIKGIRNCVPLGLAWWMNQEQPLTSMRGITTLIVVYVQSFTVMVRML